MRNFYLHVGVGVFIAAGVVSTLYLLHVLFALVFGRGAL